MSRQRTESSPGRVPLKIITVVGARPQFIKASALSRILCQSDGFEETLVHTGQHFNWNMSDIFFAELGIQKPKYNLAIHGGSHGAMTGQMLCALETIIKAEKPTAILVYGDTNSTLAGALAAAKCRVPVVHVEAGLRSYNRNMPEEVNRVVVDHLSAILFCPTPKAADNLEREGISEGVHVVGDLMFDSARRASSLAATHSSILERLGIQDRQYGVATFHRQENLEDPHRLHAIVSYLREQSRAVPLVVPLHPRTREALEDTATPIESRGIRVIEPLGYLDMCRLIGSSAIVLTDSGGLQREAYFHRVPCVTLRDETEWTESLECGWNRLWTSGDYLPRRAIPEYDRQNAGEEIACILRQAFCDAGA